METQPLIDLARYAHLLSVALGFGAAMLADIHLLTRLGRPVDDRLTATLSLCHRVIWSALAAMWLTGLLMVWIRTGFEAQNFSPKLVSKIVTVAVLTANAVLIGRMAMPLMEANAGRSLMWLPLPTKLRLAALGAVSSASWLLAMAMGVSKVLAASGWPVFLVAEPAIYAMGILFGMSVMGLLHMGAKMAPPRALTHDSATPPDAAMGTLLLVR